MSGLADIEALKTVLSEEMRAVSPLFGDASEGDDALIDIVVAYLTATKPAWISVEALDLIQLTQLRIACDAVVMLCPELINRAHLVRMKGILAEREAQMIMFFVEGPRLLV